MSIDIAKIVALSKDAKCRIAELQAELSKLSTGNESAMGMPYNPSMHTTEQTDLQIIHSLINAESSYLSTLKNVIGELSTRG